METEISWRAVSPVRPADFMPPLTELGEDGGFLCFYKHGAPSGARPPGDSRRSARPYFSGSLTQNVLPAPG